MAGTIWACDAHGANFKTKADLKRAIEAGEPVSFIDTRYDAPLRIDQIRPADVICGPNPYVGRNWYANIREGQVV